MAACQRTVPTPVRTQHNHFQRYGTFSALAIMAYALAAAVSDSRSHGCYMSMSQLCAQASRWTCASRQRWPQRTTARCLAVAWRSIFLRKDGSVLQMMNRSHSPAAGSLLISARLDSPRGCVRCDALTPIITLTVPFRRISSAVLTAQYIHHFKMRSNSSHLIRSDLMQRKRRKSAIVCAVIGLFH
jgi:hypothetical protein